MTDTIHAPLFKQLPTLYAKMDKAWTAAATHYGFQCQGCVDSCCETEFYHHTHMEKHYLLAGMKTLDPGAVKKILTRAAAVCKQRNHARNTGETVRVMCPLNIKGLCRLYDFRPMICRLHGIPHELQRPGASAVQGPGCMTGNPLFSATGYFKFDRTPFYSDMARLEMAYRTTMGSPGKIRETIAEMLIN